MVTHDIDEAVYLSDRVFVLSAPPSTVLEAIDVPLAHPREQVKTRSEAEFLKLRNHIHGLIGKKGGETAAYAAADPIAARLDLERETDEVESVP